MYRLLKGCGHRFIMGLDEVFVALCGESGIRVKSESIRGTRTRNI